MQTQCSSFLRYRHLPASFLLLLSFILHGLITCPLARADELPVSFRISAYALFPETNAALPAAQSSTTSVPQTDSPASNTGTPAEGGPSTPAEILLMVAVTPKEGFHFYAHNPGDTGRPTTIQPTPSIPDALVLYPQGTFAKDVFDRSATVRIHEGETRFFVRIPATSLSPQTLTVSLLLCSDVNCWPVTQHLSAAWTAPLPPASEQPWWPELSRYSPVAPDAEGETLTVGDTSEAARLAAEMGVELPLTAGNNALSGIQTKTSAAKTGNSATAQPETMAGWSTASVQPPPQLYAPETGYTLTPRYLLQTLEVRSLSTALLFGLLAGFLLNFMPCVLPVISLKLSSLVSATNIADEEQRTRAFREHNLWFAAGILVWFAALAALFSGADMAWGQLFQDDRILSGVLVLVFLLALATFDVFDLPMLTLRGNAVPADAQSTPASNRRSAFSAGLLATLLATPCSGPFLGGVLGWAVLQPTQIVLVTLMSVGMGMALPYLAMAARPNLVRRFPKPGMWTVVLQRMVGFFLMGTAAYLLTLLPAAELPKIVSVLWVCALAAWVWGHFASLAAPTLRRRIVRALCLLLVFGTVALLWWPHSQVNYDARWQPFSQNTFLSNAGKRNMMLDFTADWCPNCKVLEHTVLTESNRERWAKEHDILFLRVDITRAGAEGHDLLHALGSRSIPVVALFPAGSQATAPVVLRDLFTTSMAEEALAEAFGGALP